MVQVVNKVRYLIVKLTSLKIKIFVKNVMKIIIYIQITALMHHVVRSILIIKMRYVKVILILILTIKNVVFMILN